MMADAERMFDSNQLKSAKIQAAQSLYAQLGGANNANGNGRNGLNNGGNGLAGGLNGLAGGLNGFELQKLAKEMDEGQVGDWTLQDRGDFKGEALKKIAKRGFKVAHDKKRFDASFMLSKKKRGS